MRFYSDNRDNTPLRYIGRVPVYVATIFTAVFCVGMLATAMMKAAGGPIYLFAFSTEYFFHHGWLWQIVTAPLVSYPDFFFPFWVIFFYQFAVELEKFFGRRTFLLFYAILSVTMTLSLGVWHLVSGPGAFHGMTEITIGMFVGYATLYPDLEFIGWVPVKYVAFACLAVSALSYFSDHNWQGLTVLCCVCAVSFGFIRYIKLGGALELGEWAGKINPFRRRPKIRVMPSPSGGHTPRANSGSGGIGSVDAILDKIARDGFASLTQNERDQLERTRDILNKKKL